jgi:hypothetical protein
MHMLRRLNVCNKNRSNLKQPATLLDAEPNVKIFVYFFYKITVPVSCNNRLLDAKVYARDVCFFKVVVSWSNRLLDAEEYAKAVFCLKNFGILE